MSDYFYSLSMCVLKAMEEEKSAAVFVPLDVLQDLEDEENQ